MLKNTLTPFGIAGASVGMGIIGKELGNTQLIEAGETSGKFIAPAINVTMGGYLVNQLKKFKKI